MTVDVSTAASPLEVSVDLLERYFAARTAASGVRPAVAVDVDLLGMRDLLAKPADPDLRSEVVFPVRLYGSVAILGPRCPADGSVSPCPRCLERRWQLVRPAEERQALELGGQVRAAGPMPFLTAFALEAMWQVFVTASAEPEDPTKLPLVYELRLDTLQLTRFRLIADSDCPQCSERVPDTAEAAVIELQPSPKRAVNSYRLRGADELEVPIDGYANPVCGAIGASAMRAYQCTATAPVSGYFRVRSKYDLHDMWWSGHADSYGASELFGVLEGLERFAGQRSRTKRIDVYDSLDNLGSTALNPLDCGVYTPEFYEGRSFHYEPFTPQRRLPWVWGHSLRDHRSLLVPEQIVYYLDDQPDVKNFVQECSNGCASGSSMEEALFHGMMELVERDAFLLSWYAGARMPEIDLSTCRDPKVHFMIDRVGLLGYDMRVFDMRVDLPMPAVMAVAVRRDGGMGKLCIAAGASFDPDDAVRAAVCEVASYVPGFPERVTDSGPQLREMVQDYGKVTQLSEHPLLYGLPEMSRHAEFLFDSPPLVPMDELYADWLAERPATLDLADDVRYFADRIAGTGTDVIAVDQTCPEQRIAGTNTACVIAPGLVPIDFGWYRQRVLHSPRLRAFLAGQLPSGGLRGAGLGPTGLNLNPHPFP